MGIDAKAAAELLRGYDDILILTHKKPDGDCLGSGFGLLWALEALGKRARVENADGFPPRYRFLTGDYEPASFSPRYIVAVDTAGHDLLGALDKALPKRIDLCIDHHTMNTIDAEHKLVDPSAPATALLIHRILGELGVPVGKKIADALFTGLSTDTGCFKFYSVTAEVHRAAADLIEAGADHGLINMLMFDTMSRERVAADTLINSTLEYACGGLAAFITVRQEDIDRSGVDEADLDGISSFPRKIEGVMLGVTLREQGAGYRVSVRAREGLDAAALCARFGGGGHKAAAGCSLSGDLAAVKAALLPAVAELLTEAGLSWTG